MIKILKKYFWVWISVLLTAVSLISYGFVKDLYFYLEDYQIIYSYFTKIPYYGWPYQGLSIIYYPFNLILNGNPSNYFIVGLILYIIAALLLTILIWKLTRDELVASIAGLIFASGYVGSQSIFWIAVAIVSNLYLILLFTLIILYKNYFNYFILATKKSLFVLLKKISPILVILIILLVLFSHRAFVVVVIILFVDIYYLSQGIKKIYWKNISEYVWRVLPFVILTIIVYTVLSKFLRVSQDNFNLKNQDLISYFSLQFLTKTLNLNILQDFGNFFIPSSIQEIFNQYILQNNHNLGIYLGRIIGLFWLLIYTMYLLFGKFKKGIKRTLIFLMSSAIASYVPFYIFEPNIVHQSWHRYLIFAFPFFAAALALLITELFLKSQKRLLQIFGVIFLLTIILSNIILSRTSTFSIKTQNRSLLAKNFFTTLENENLKPQVKTIFYFDIANDAKVQETYHDILASGVFPAETALAVFYKMDVNRFKIVINYDELKEEVKKGGYEVAYFFFYNKNHTLIYNGKFLIKDNKINNFIPSKIAEQTLVKLNEQNQSQVEILKTPITYNSNSQFKKIEIVFSNKILAIPINNFSTLFPIEVNLKMQINPKIALTSDISYLDESISFQMAEKYGGIIKNKSQLETIPEFIAEREYFKKTFGITTSSSEYPTKANYLIDGNKNTNWMSNKKAWWSGEKPWIQINIPDNYSFSEVHWLTTYKSRFPISYVYQVADSINGPWKTIYQINKIPVRENEYKVDKIPKTTTKYFRMMILESSGDFPAISEIEIFENQYDIDLTLVDFLMQHPLFENDLWEVFKNLQQIKIYPISDKYLNKYNTISVEKNIILDGIAYTYALTLPAGGTTLNQILLEFPNIPLEATIYSITLKQLPF